MYIAQLFNVEMLYLDVIYVYNTYAISAHYYIWQSMTVLKTIFQECGHYV